MNKMRGSEMGSGGDGAVAEADLPELLGRPFRAFHCYSLLPRLSPRLNKNIPLGLPCLT